MVEQHLISSLKYIYLALSFLPYENSGSSSCYPLSLFYDLLDIEASAFAPVLATKYPVRRSLGQPSLFEAFGEKETYMPQFV